MIIGIETSGARGSVAILSEDQLLADHRFPEGRRHARDIMIAVDDLVRAAGVEKSEIGAVAVSQGPGSFTGLRVGVTCAKTLAYLLGWQAVGVSSLEVMAQNVDAVQHGCGAVCPLLDARRSFVYGTVFRWEDGRWRDLTGVMAGEPREVAERIPPGSLIFGSGVDAYADVFLSQQGRLRAGPCWLAEGKGEHAARLGLKALREGRAVPPMQLLAKYYRRTQAEEKLTGGT